MFVDVRVAIKERVPDHVEPKWTKKSKQKYNAYGTAVADDSYCYLSTFLLEGCQ